MYIRIRTTSQVMSEDEFRLMHQTTSFPRPLPLYVLSEYDADPVNDVPPPSVSITQSAVNAGAEYVDGQWQMKWDVVDLLIDVANQALADAQKHMWWKIRTERDRRKSLGVLVDGNWFHSDDSSRIQQLAMVMMGNDMPADLTWKTMTGEFVNMTPLLARRIFTETGLSDKLIFANAEYHRVAMMASNDPTNYDFSTNWPIAFDEVNNVSN